MTALPQPASPDNGFCAAPTTLGIGWYRVIDSSRAGQTVAQYQYDGRGYRTLAQTDPSGVLSEARDFYYSDQWQVVEERVGRATSPNGSSSGACAMWTTLWFATATPSASAARRAALWPPRPQLERHGAFGPDRCARRALPLFGLRRADVPFRSVLFDRLVLVRRGNPLLRLSLGRGPGIVLGSPPRALVAPRPLGSQRARLAISAELACTALISSPTAPTRLANGGRGGLCRGL